MSKTVEKRTPNKKSSPVSLSKQPEDQKNGKISDKVDKMKVKTMNGVVNGLPDDAVKVQKKIGKKTGKSEHLNGTGVDLKGNHLKDNLDQNNKKSVPINPKNHVKLDQLPNLKPQQNNALKFDSKASSSQQSNIQIQHINFSENHDGPIAEEINRENNNEINGILSSDLCTITEPESISRLEFTNLVDKEKAEVDSCNTQVDSTVSKKCDVVKSLDNLNIKEEIREAEPWKEDASIGELPIEIPIVEYMQYESELQMPMIMKIIQKDLSEPYSIYTYRYFIHNWPNLCFLAMCGEECVGAIVCKLDLHRKVIKRGYIAMLAVDKNYRKQGIGSTLVRRAIQEMILGNADEVVLETEITNKPALKLYEALGFVRDKRLFRYYLNGVDALRLKLWLR